MAVDKTEPRTDFDELTGKLVPVSRLAAAPEAEPFATPPVKEPFLANPLRLAPTGSGSGHVSRADFARSGVILASVYGLLQMASPMILQVLNAVGPGGKPFVPHGDMLADAFSACVAAAVAIAHVVMAFTSDNRPRVDATTVPTPAITPTRLP